jgi:hypothetical protein
LKQGALVSSGASGLICLSICRTSGVSAPWVPDDGQQPETKALSLLPPLLLTLRRSTPQSNMCSQNTQGIPVGKLAAEAVQDRCQAQHASHLTVHASGEQGHYISCVGCCPPTWVCQYVRVPQAHQLRREGPVLLGGPGVMVVDERHLKGYTASHHRLTDAQGSGTTSKRTCNQQATISSQCTSTHRLAGPPAHETRRLALHIQAGGGMSPS